MFLQDPAFERFFKKLVITLRPYLADLVCIGGCANALYRYHPLAAPGGPAYLGTKDVDWAVCPPLRVKDETKLVAALMSDSGFKDLSGIHILVPNPAAYFVQKVLIRSQGRPRELMEKDCYYLYEISVLFRNAHEELGTVFKSMQRLSPSRAKWLRDYQHEAARLFHSATSEGTTAAARVYRDAYPDGSASGEVTPEMVYRSVQKMLAILSH